MSKKYNILFSPVFLIGLVILFLNDHFLKYSTPGFITGKLSDFVGLFLFGLFWIVLIPNQKKTVLTLVALGFLFWKTEVSNSLLIYINGVLPFSVDRTVDYSDLIALTILPFTLIFYKRQTPKDFKLRVIHLIPSLLIFSATSYVHPIVEESSKLNRVTIGSVDYCIKMSNDKYNTFVNNAVTGEFTPKFGRFKEVQVRNDTLLIHYVSNLYVPIDSIDGDFLFAITHFRVDTINKKTSLDLLQTEAYVRHDNVDKDIFNLLKVIKKEIKYVYKSNKN